MCANPNLNPDLTYFGRAGPYRILQQIPKSEISIEMIHNIKLKLNEIFYGLFFPYFNSTIIAPIKKRFCATYRKMCPQHRPHNGHFVGFSQLS